MRRGSYFLETLRETPSEAEIISHRLMMRAGMIKKISAGVYTYLPLGLLAIRKVENIIRSCMNNSGAIELLMPSVQPAELWKESGRWNYYGKELLRFKDRGGRDFCLGPTHEEVITDVVRSIVRSYKQLPLNLYQIQTKFRDEVRPRFGLMRAREFIMKDAYSFDIDDGGAEKSYNKMYETYCEIFKKCGLRFKVVDADSGSIGGSFSHEFMVLADTGEDAVISCKSCEYSANIEKAIVIDKTEDEKDAAKSPEKVATPNLHTAVDVAKFLDVDLKKVVKTMILKCEGVPENNKTTDKLVAIVVAGTHEVNLAKVKNLLGAVTVDFALPEDVASAVGCNIGSLGPLGMKLEVYVDNAVKHMKNIVVGANEEGYHIKNVNPDVDFTPKKYADLRNAEVGDICPKCGGVYELTRGIEVGHIFKLGLKYSNALSAKALDKNGKNIPLSMGCYGIGVGRIVAAAIEQSNDDKGIVWPKSIAPFVLNIVTLNTEDADVMKKAEELYNEFNSKNIDTMLDDRNERTGVKLIDAELIGFPLTLVISKKALAEGQIEVIVRKSGERLYVPIKSAVQDIINILDRI